MNESNSQSQGPDAKKLRKQYSSLTWLLALICMPAALFQLVGGSWLSYRVRWSQIQVSRFGIAIGLITLLLVLTIGWKIAKAGEFLREKDG